MDIDFSTDHFTLGEHPLSKGDITPFVAMFCEIIAESLERVRQVLEEKRTALRECESMLSHAINSAGGISGKAGDLAYVLVQATLFSDCGLSVKQIGVEFGISKATVYKLIQEVERVVPLSKDRRGREMLYTANLDAFATICSTSA